MDTIGGHPVSSVPVIVAREQRLHVTCRDTPQLPGLLLEHPPHEDDRSKVELLLCVCLRRDQETGDQETTPELEQCHVNIGGLVPTFPHC